MAEAMSLIAAVKSAQERYLARGGSYTSNFTQLDISYPGMTATGITTKFFSAAVTATNAASGPTYQLTVTRHTTNSSVAARYGTYALTCNVPNSPTVVMTAPSATLNELLD
ncbi:MAG: hypothetical protein CVV01_03705 [Firmicutes bacterium HGW-Firmicutes-6]|nr:MAG: hypothetical protein CVV01_03705 [Firmicutes bacterium HGW-Firmicutes-6]